MARNITQEERQLLKLIEKLPDTVAEKNGWADRIRGGEMSNELAEEMRQKLMEPGGGEAEGAHARHLVELTNIVKQWRLASQSRNFGRR